MSGTIYVRYPCKVPPGDLRKGDNIIYERSGEQRINCSDSKNTAVPRKICLEIMINTLREGDFLVVSRGKGRSRLHFIFRVEE